MLATAELVTALLEDVLGSGLFELMGSASLLPEATVSVGCTCSWLDLSRSLCSMSFMLLVSVSVFLIFLRMSSTDFLEANSPAWSRFFPDDEDELSFAPVGEGKLSVRALARIIYCKLVVEV